jgi:predicted transcriptional regulator
MGKPRMTYEQILDKFWKNVDKKGPNECWEWSGRRVRGGYGSLSIRSHHGCANRAHRFSMALHLGRLLEKEEWVLHSCDNPPCVNPRHLFLGDTNANMADMVAKGRSAHGETHNKAKLTNEDVRAIVETYRKTRKTYKELAEEFKVCTLTISNILKGRRWKHLGLGSPESNRRGRKMPKWFTAGERSSAVKLNNEVVLRIRRKYAAGRWTRRTTRKMALKYGVNKETIRSIIKGQTWKCLL